MDLNTKVIALLASLFGLDSDKVTGILTDKENDGSLIQEFISSRNILTAEQHAQIVKNAKQQGVDDLLTAEKVPQKLYDRIKGGVLEKLEKGLKSKHEVEEYDGFDDLLEKIVSKGSAKQGDNEAIITQLRDKIKTLQAEHETALTDKSRELLDYVSNNALNEALFAQEIDAEGEKLEVQRDILRTMYNKTFENKVDKQENGQVDITVIDRATGKPVQDETLLSNKTVLEVLSEFAPTVVNIKAPKGRGSSSVHDGGGAGSSDLKGLSENDLINHIQKLGHDLMSDKAGEIRESWEKENNATFLE